MVTRAASNRWMDRIFLYIWKDFVWLHWERVTRRSLKLIGNIRIVNKKKNILQWLSNYVLLINLQSILSKMFWNQLKGRTVWGETICDNNNYIILFHSVFCWLFWITRLSYSSAYSWSRMNFIIKHNCHLRVFISSTNKRNVDKCHRHCHTVDFINAALLFTLFLHFDSYNPNFPTQMRHGSNYWPAFINAFLLFFHSKMK